MSINSIYYELLNNRTDIEPNATKEIKILTDRICHHYEALAERCGNLTHKDFQPLYKLYDKIRGERKPPSKSYDILLGRSSTR